MSVTTDSIFVASFATVIGAPVRIISASFSLALSISTWLIKKLLKQQELRRKDIIKL